MDQRTAKPICELLDIINNRSQTVDYHIPDGHIVLVLNVSIDNRRSLLATIPNKIIDHEPSHALR